MKRSTISTLLIAGALAGLMGTAAPAQMAEFTQIEQSVKAGLSTLQINTDNLDLLTMAQISKLAAILDNGDTDQAETQAAKNVIEMAVNPSADATKTPEGMVQLEMLKANLDRVGVKYTGLEGLTADQVLQLSQVFDANKNDDPAAKQAAKAIIIAIGTPTNAPSDNAGVVQLGMQVSTKLSALGITPPAQGLLTLAQVGSLTAIFDQQGSTDAEQKTSAMAVLAVN